MAASNVLFSGILQWIYNIENLLIWLHRQDLNCSVVAGSSRLFDHTTFVELDWRRDPFTPNFYTLTPGFRARAHLFSDEFIRILEDTHALQCIRDSPNFGCKDTGEMMRYDSHQGSVQSRLVDLPKDSIFLECCYLATYISACQLCSKAWRALAIPVSSLPLLYVILIPYEETSSQSSIGLYINCVTRKATTSGY